MAMSFSDCSSMKEIEFAYQTRLVVYNFFGLLPAQEDVESDLEQKQPLEEDEDEIEYDGLEQPTSQYLSSLPKVSLIEKLKDSEDHYAKNKSLCDELTKRVKRANSISPKSAKQKKFRILNNSQRTLPEELLQEIRLSGVGLNRERWDESIQQMTVIQKRYNMKVIINPAKHNQESVESLQPRSTGHLGGFNLHLDMSNKYISKFQSGENDFSDSEVTPTENSFENSVNHFQYSSQEPLTTPLSQLPLLRQVSSVSSSSRLCSTYVDVNEVDNETLASYKNMSKMTLNLKNTLSEAICRLESDYSNQLRALQSQSVDRGDFRSPVSSVSFNSSSPESRVADMLRAIGDQLNYEFYLNETLINQMVDCYHAGEELFKEAFRRGIEQLISGMSCGWNRVALVLMMGQRLLMRFLDMEPTQIIITVTELIASMVEQQMGDFIVVNGGWDGVAQLGLLEQPLDLGLSEVFSFGHVDSADTSASGRDDDGKTACNNTASVGGDNRADEVLQRVKNVTADLEEDANVSFISGTSTLYTSALDSDSAAHDLATKCFDRLIKNDVDQGSLTRDAFMTPELYSPKNVSYLESISDVMGHTSSLEMLSTPTEELLSPIEDQSKSDSSDEGLPDNSGSQSSLGTRNSVGKTSREQAAVTESRSSEAEVTTNNNNLPNARSERRGLNMTLEFGRDTHNFLMETLSSPRFRDVFHFSFVVGGLFILWKVFRKAR